MADSNEGIPSKTQRDYILELRDWNPPLLTIDPRTKDTCPPLELSPKHTFYDKHLHEGLSLKRVSSIPSLDTAFKRALHAAFARIVKEGIHLPPFSDDDEFYEPYSELSDEDRCLKDANAVVDFYYRSTSISCSPLASVFLHPYMPTWDKILCWIQYEKGTAPAPFEEGCTLRIPEHNRELVLDTDMAEALSDEDTEVLRKLAARFQYLGTWQVFALSDKSETLIKAMGALPRRFKQETCPTTGYAASSRPAPLTVDAMTPQWHIELKSAATDADANAKSSLRSGGQPRAPVNSRAVADPNVAQPSAITVPSIKKQASAMRSPSSAEAFLEHAWCESVRNDTTVIVFHCGSLERIGIRHRESQTLFLSELIDVNKCKDPAYGTLQIGLYIAIFKDAVERAHRLAEAEAEAEAEKELKMASGRSKRAKRRRDDRPEPPSSNKRRKIITRSSGRQESPAADVVEREQDLTDVVLEHCVDRDMMFLALQNGVYHSASPASFIRQGAALVHGASNLTSIPTFITLNRQRRFLPRQYVQFTIASNVGYGAIGVVHGGKFEVTNSKGVAYSCPAVIKLAFSDDQKERMRYEYSIHKHLAAYNVKGVSRVFGLFQDTLPGGPLALVMSFEGPTLLQCRPANPGPWEWDGLISVNETERDAFMKIMHDIHRAGVIHNDIRPENLLLKPDGHATIIDFDQATLETRRYARKSERRDLRDILRGVFARPSGRAPPTPKGVVYSDSDSDDRNPAA